MTARNVLWARRFVTANDKDMMAAAEGIAATEFDFVILGVLHVHPGGVLYFNDTPVDQLSPQLVEALNLIRNSSPAKTISVSIGNSADFEHMSAALPAFVKAMHRLFNRYPLDGVDFNYEGPDYSPTMAKQLAKLGRATKIALPDVILTASPSQAQEFWLGEDGLLANAHTVDGCLFDGFNLRFYEAQNAIPPDQWSATFDQWLEMAKKPWNGILGDEASRFLIPGANADGEYFNPAGLQQEKFGQQAMQEGINAIANQHPGIGGAFIWRWEFIEADAKTWAQTMRQSLVGYQPA